MNISVSETNENDIPGIRHVYTTAFGESTEADLAEEIMSDPSAHPIISLKGNVNVEIVGHILFSRIYTDGSSSDPLMHILCPMAVLPEWNKSGIGGRLIRQGMDLLRAMGSELVVVLGHETYYPRHGFIQDAANLGIEAPYPIPAKNAGAWMVKSLRQDGQITYQGKIRCADALSKPEYWVE